MKRIVIKALCTLMGVSIILGGCKATPASSESKISAAAVTVGDLTLGLTADGKVALPVTPLNFEVEGIIKVVYVKTGDSVKEGDLLAEIDDEDYRLKVKNAKNALEKAQTNYDAAVGQRDYSLLSDSQTIASLEKQLAKTFDSYTYELNIYEAEKSLERKTAALVTAQETAADPFDPYSYQNSVDEAKLTMEKRDKDLAAAKADYEDALAAELEDFDDRSLQNAVKEAGITLDRKKAELEKANKNLSDAKADTGDKFDDYAYKTKITDAQTTYDRKYNEYGTALANYEDALAEYNSLLKTAAADALKNVDASSVAQQKRTLDDAQTAAARAQEALWSAAPEADWTKLQQAADDAQAKYERANEDYNKAVDTYNANLKKYADNAVDTAKTNADKLKDAADAKKRELDDAKTSLARAKDDLSRASGSYGETTSDSLEKAVKSAQEAADSAQRSFDDAQRSYDNAVYNLNHDRESYITTNTDKLADNITAAKKTYESAQSSANDAKRAYDKSLTDMENARVKAIKDADSSLKSAVQAADDAKDSLNKAKNDMVRAKADFLAQQEDTRENYELKTLSVANSQSSDSSVTDALYSIESAKLDLESAENTLEKTKLYATKDGQVISVSKSAGEKAQAVEGGLDRFLGTGGTSGVITICDVTEIYLSASVSESDIVGLVVGQTVNVTIDSIGDRVFKGKIDTISNIPTTDSNGITTYAVTVLLDELNTEIRDGMNALINFVKKELPNVLTVPVKAVFIENNKQYVNKVVDGAYVKTEVITGLSDGTRAQVVKGLAEGDMVVVGKLK